MTPGIRQRSGVRAAVFLLAALAPSATAAGECRNAALLFVAQLAGTWQVSRDGQIVGELSMQPAAGGCALIEYWQGADGTQANALHWSEAPSEAAAAGNADDDARREPLRQVYVDSTGWAVKAEGRIENGVLVYQGETERNGGKVLLRAVMHGLGTDRIVHIGEVSTDGGASWQRVSTLRYERLHD